MIIKKAISFIRKDFIIERSYKMAFFVAIFNSMLPILSFFFIGKLIGDTSRLDKYQGDYFSFAFIGICFTTYFQLAITTFSDSIRRAQMAGCLEAILSSQTSPKAIVLNSSFYSFISAFVQIFILFIGAMLIFNLKLPNANLLSFGVAFLLSLLCFMGLGILSAVGTIIFKKGEPFALLFGALSSIIGGAFFPISIMPSWLQAISYLFPISYSLDAIRLTLLNGAGIEEILPQLLILLFLSISIFPISLFAFHKAVEIGKREGTLIQY